MRLNWGCGPVLAEGWVNSDESEYAQSPLGRYPQHLGRIQDGLPFPDGTFEYVVSHHALQMLPEVDLVPALAELRRVTMPGGWLRLSVPALFLALDAWRNGDLAWFPLEARDVDEALCRYITQNGATRSVFTVGYLALIFRDAGWTRDDGSSTLHVVGHGKTRSAIPGITDLDSRPNESLYVEARR